MLVNTPKTEKTCQLQNGPLKKRPVKFCNKTISELNCESSSIDNANSTVPMLEGKEKNYPLRSLPTVWNLAFLLRKGENQASVNRSSTSNLPLESKSSPLKVNHPEFMQMSVPVPVPKSVQFKSFPLKRSRKFANLHLLVSTPFPRSSIIPIQNATWHADADTDTEENSQPKSKNPITFSTSPSTMLPSMGSISSVLQYDEFPAYILSDMDFFCPRPHYSNSSLNSISYTIDVSNNYYSNCHSRSYYLQNRSMGKSSRDRDRDLEMPIQIQEFEKSGNKSKNNLHFNQNQGCEPTKCKFCGKSYVSGCALKRHTQTHTRPFRCHYCGKCFSRPWLLQGHLRTHTGEKPFSCHQCERAFADPSNLRAHLQTHTKNKRYLCKKCSKSFSRMSLLLNHREKAKGSSACS